MPRAHLMQWTFEPTGDMCNTVSRRDTCFWDGRPYATKCEKDIVVSQDNHSMLR